MSEKGRKYTMAMVGIACTVVLTVLAMGLSVFVPAASATITSILPIAIGSIAGMVATFITGNSAIAFAYSRNESSRSDSYRTISERRDAAAGIEPTP